MSVLFFLILIAGIILYISGRKVASLLIFLFFIFDAFQVIPESALGIKSVDYALIYVLVLFIWGCFNYQGFICFNVISKCIFIYLGFIVFEFLLSRFYYGIGWIEIIKTGRQNFFLLSYFILRRIGIAERKVIIKMLYIILLGQSTLFVIQVFTGLELLTEAQINYKAGLLYRCYNMPLMLYFFVFCALFYRPFENRIMRVIAMGIPLAALFLPMHRSLSISFATIAFFGFLWKKGMFKSVRNTIISGVVGVLVLFFASHYVSSRTLNDINQVVQGDFLDFEDGLELDKESTLLFRLAHFYERFVTTLETPVGAMFGVGFMAEGSKYTNEHFDFIIGLTDDANEVIQLDTSDVSWSLFIIRYGIIGTLIYLSFYFIIVYCFLIKGQQNRLSLCIALYLLLLFAISVTSDFFYKNYFLALPLLLYDDYALKFKVDLKAE